MYAIEDDRHARSICVPFATNTTPTTGRLRTHRSASRRAEINRERGKRALDQYRQRRELNGVNKMDSTCIYPLIRLAVAMRILSLAALLGGFATSCQTTTLSPTRGDSILAAQPRAAEPSRVGAPTHVASNAAETPQLPELPTETAARSSDVANTCCDRMGNGRCAITPPSPKGSGCSCPGLGSGFACR